MRLVLGSGSPRRRALLAQIGVVPSEIRVPDIDETPVTGELPRTYCRRISAQKAAALDVAEDEVLLCADTTVALGRRILGKPQDAAEAERYLAALSGRRHQVITVVTVKTPQCVRSRDVVSIVRMQQLTQRHIADYIATGDWMGKAGGYGIQGPAGVFIPWMRGSYSAVVGLPLAETAALLGSAGVPVTGAP